MPSRPLTQATTGGAGAEPSPGGGDAGLAEATAHQPRAAAALTAALRAPGHAYLFRGPRGSGKRAAARAFAAELLARGSTDPEEARRRALLDPSPHPDLVWVRPPGAWHLVDEIREAVIRAAVLRPLEGERRVFVIEAAEAMRDESQNALLKTLEEPAPFAHLILTCSEPDLLLATIVSRCAPAEFSPLTPEAVIERLGIDASPEHEAIARLCGGDLELARLLLTGSGRRIRADAESAARAARRAERDPHPPWAAMLERAEESGREAAREASERLAAGQADSGRRGAVTREANEQVRRAERRSRTEALDLGLALCSAWFRDLVAVAEGAPKAVLNCDRLDELAGDAASLEPARARRAVELVLETRRRLRLNVSEQLALEALWFRLSQLFR